MVKKITTIKIEESVKDLLDKERRKGESYSNAIQSLIIQKQINSLGQETMKVVLKQAIAESLFLIAIDLHAKKLKENIGVNKNDTANRPKV
jgi:hypothetical protein